MQSFFLKRGGNSQERKEAVTFTIFNFFKLQRIIDRQDISEKGDLPPLAIYPEGATTNNEYILPFKKGAFIGGKSIKPLSFKFHGKISSSNGMMGLFPHFFLMSCEAF